ncbi:biotin--[acetyl-CoA-carboxylase] ligase [Filimonas lacunae]|uniref:biotin--[acetyl-CoA-carboxylase] ligase n=1 Tax=Filimonas lacunae TaxID=477680 RepID=UPI0007D73740|nr:biotin--[acetyl-CoA-carboxylase] ligase [Filimonas lacunae]BAV09928.1 biotin/acetyl-CoA-carboxylase ligase [Filimonas lacunae]
MTSVDSTNNYAMGIVQNGAGIHGSAWFAHEQTAGKGQRGKVWKTAPLQNVILSVLLDTSWLPLSKQFYLSMAASLAWHDFYSKYALDETRIKWPNDLYWRDRKAGGMLIETVVKGSKWQWAVVGMGTNVNQGAFEELQRAVSLRQITGKTFDTVALAKELCACLQIRYTQLQQSINNPEKERLLLESYNNILFKRGERVMLRKENTAFTCVIDYVDSNGLLWVKEAMQESFQFGEVQWVL